MERANVERMVDGARAVDSRSSSPYNAGVGGRGHPQVSPLPLTSYNLAVARRSPPGREDKFHTPQRADAASVVSKVSTIRREIPMLAALIATYTVAPVVGTGTADGARKSEARSSKDGDRSGASHHRPS